MSNINIDSKMEFNPNKAIYLQIRDSFCERILSGELNGGDRIPSVREYGAAIGVNPNTVMRTYEKLTAEGVIFNKRGIGYFISPDARETVLESSRKEFLEQELPVVIRKMELLGLDPERILSQCKTPDGTGSSSGDSRTCQDPSGT